LANNRAGNFQYAVFTSMLVIILFQLNKIIDCVYRRNDASITHTEIYRKDDAVACLHRLALTWRQG